MTNDSVFLKNTESLGLSNSPALLLAFTLGGVSGWETRRKIEFNMSDSLLGVTDFGFLDVPNIDLKNPI